MPLLDIALQVDLLVPLIFVLGIIGTLLGVIYKMLNDRIKEQGLRIDKLEAKTEATILRVEDKLDKVLDVVNKLAVAQARQSTVIDRE